MKHLYDNMRVVDITFLPQNIQCFLFSSCYCKYINMQAYYYTFLFCFFVLGTTFVEKNETPRIYLLCYIIIVELLIVPC